MEKQEEFGESSNKKRLRFTTQEKMAYLRKVMRKQNEGMSERAACKSLNINNKQIQIWQKQSTQLKELKIERPRAYTFVWRVYYMV